MIRLKKLGHIQLRVGDLERSKAFYRDVLGFRVAEQDPKHGDLFMTLGEDFHTLDMAQHENPETAKGSVRPLGVAHIAFQVASYEGLEEAYRTLLEHGVRFPRYRDLSSRTTILHDLRPVAGAVELGEVPLGTGAAAAGLRRGDLVLQLGGGAVFPFQISSSSQVVSGLRPGSRVTVVYHPLGATGIANIFEVTTHLRGEAGKRQVQGARLGMTHVIGLGSACGIHILEKFA